MRTPCQTNPEAWVSDNPTDRADAMRECVGCWRQAECLTEALTLGVTAGVWGGRDFTRSRLGNDAPPILDCLNCGAALVINVGNGPRKKFCGRKCNEAHKYAKRRAAA